MCRRRQLPRDPQALKPTAASSPRTTTRSPLRASVGATVGATDGAAVGSPRKPKPKVLKPLDNVAHCGHRCCKTCEFGFGTAEPFRVDAEQSACVAAAQRFDGEALLSARSTLRRQYLHQLMHEPLSAYANTMCAAARSEAQPLV